MTKNKKRKLRKISHKSRNINQKKRLHQRHT